MVKTTRRIAIAVAALMAAQASAMQTVAPFLSVDINGANGQTEAGFSPWNLDSVPGPIGVPLTETFGGVTVDLTGLGAPATNFNSRNRTTSDTPEPPPFPPPPAFPQFFELYDDFVFVGGDQSQGLGVERFQIDFSGLMPNTTYEFTFYTADVTANQLHEIGFTLDEPTPFALGNPPPVNAFSDLGGAFVDGDDQFLYAAVFQADTDAMGEITIWSFHNPSAITGQLANILNGFEVGLVGEGGGGGGVVPEPASLALLAVGGVLFARRRRTA